MAGEYTAPPGAGSQNRRNLRDDPRAQGVSQEDVGVPAQGHHTFLNPRPPGVVEANDRNPKLQSQIHDLADLFRMRFGEGAAKHRKVLGENRHRPAINAAKTGHHPIAGDALRLHAKVVAAVGDQPIQLRKGAFV